MSNQLKITKYLIREYDLKRLQIIHLDILTDLFGKIFKQNGINLVGITRGNRGQCIIFVY
jgi:hypothetical protein